MSTNDSNKDCSNSYEDKFKVVLTINNREEVPELIRKHGLNIIESHILKDDKKIKLTFFQTNTQIEELKEAGYKPEVGENVSEIGRKRQTEVGKGDRFEGGKIPPKGLGTLTKEPN